MLKFSRILSADIKHLNLNSLHITTTQCIYQIYIINSRGLYMCNVHHTQFYFQIKSMGATINYSRHELYTGILVKVQIFTSLLFIALSAYSCRNFIGIMFVSGFFLSYVIVNAVFGALLGLFTFLLLNVKLRFKNLNENLWSVILFVLFIELSKCDKSG